MKPTVAETLDVDELLHNIHMYVPHRSVYFGDVVLIQTMDNVLTVCRSKWSRVAMLSIACVIGGLCSAFLYYLVQRLSLDSARLSHEMLLIGAIAGCGGLFSLALMSDVFLRGPIRFDRKRNEVERTGWFPGRWKHDLGDVVAIQLCRGKCDIHHGDRAAHTTVTLQYQVNLVLRGNSTPIRRNISQQEHRDQVVQIGRRLAEFLSVPLLNYVGPPGTMKAADAEARRLLS